MTASLAITDEDLIKQVASLTVTSSDGDHLLELDPTLMVIAEEDLMTAAQVMYYLEMGQWTGPRTRCTKPGCVLSHRSTKVKTHHESAPDPELGLVARSTTTLADLYRKARKKGLVAPTSSYN